MPPTRTAASGSNARSRKPGTGRPAASRTPDLLAQLKADHREVAAMHKAYDKLIDAQAGAAERGALALQICRALAAHAKAEEELLYRPLRSALEEQDLLDEADIEHASARQLIGEIEKLHPDDDKYDARVVVLCEYVAHHVKEEEGEIFPKARKAKELDLKALGEAFAQRKAQLLARAAS